VSKAETWPWLRALLSLASQRTKCLEASGSINIVLITLNSSKLNAAAGSIKMNRPQGPYPTLVDGIIKWLIHIFDQRITEFAHQYVELCRVYWDISIINAIATGKGSTLGIFKGYGQVPDHCLTYILDMYNT
jgi:hypothetical protein